MIVGLLVLVSTMDVGASAEIVTIPLLLIGLGMGGLASQLGKRHRLVGPQRKESRGGRPPEHGDAIRRLARHRACRLGPRSPR